MGWAARPGHADPAIVLRGAAARRQDHLGQAARRQLTARCNRLAEGGHDMDMTTWTADCTTRGPANISPTEWRLRVDLAAAFRQSCGFGWTKSLGTHASAVIPGADSAFLMNPCWMLFSEIRASDLMRLDWTDEDTIRLISPAGASTAGCTPATRLRA